MELCENMSDGGCTPSAGTISFARKNLHIGLFVMIRPRGADFCYSEDEFEIMKQDLLTARQEGADGVVFGILHPDGTIDKERMSELVQLARPMGVTCHRAFDMTCDPLIAMEALISIGINRILTSGQSDSALDGAPLIRELIEKAAGRIIIMPGHGIKEHNFAKVMEATGADEFHLYLTKQVTTSMEFLRDGVKMGKPDQSEYETTLVDADKFKRVKEIILKR